jgi:carbamoyl-phosphate synthase large subunit
LISVAQNLPLPKLDPTFCKTSAIYYFNLTPGTITHCKDLSKILEVPGLIEFKFDLKEGDRINRITNSLDRYGYVIIQAENREQLQMNINLIFDLINQNITIKKDDYVN